MKTALLDSSAIVAAFDPSDRQHEVSRDAIDSWKGELFTCEAVLTETCYLLRRLPGGPEAVLDNVVRNRFRVPFRLTASASAVQSLLRKYRDQQIDLADACLIHLAGEIASGDIFTLDRDFEVYRWGRHQSFRLLIPRE